MLLPVITHAARIVGSVQKLADALGVKRSTMYEWEKVPADLVMPMEKAQRAAFNRRPRRIMTRYDIRPDLYRKKANGKCPIS